MRSASILAVIAATLLVSPIRSQEGATPASKDKTDASAKKVQELRKERIAVLEKMTEQLAALFRTAKVDYVEVLEAQRLLLEAKLDAAETDKERVELYKQLVDVLKAREKSAEARRQAGREIEPNVLKARARRLEAEIHLEQAKMKAAKAGK
jgi:hypothetical protein